MFITCSCLFHSFFTIFYNLFMTYSGIIHNSVTICSQLFHNFFKFFHDLFMNCSGLVQDLFTWEIILHDMFTIGSQLVQDLVTTCWQFVYNLVTTRSWLFHYFFGHNIFTIFSLLVWKPPWNTLVFPSKHLWNILETH